MASKRKIKQLDYRSKFANSVCYLLYKKHEGNIDTPNFMYEMGRMIDHFEENVRNIYELDDEIPLVYYYRLNEYGADNFGVSEIQHRKNIAHTKKQCESLYTEENYIFFLG